MLVINFQGGGWLGGQVAGLIGNKVEDEVEAELGIINIIYID